MQFSSYAAAAPQPKFLDVDRDNTLFAYDLNRKVVIATRGNDLTVFESETQERLKQKPDYYNAQNTVDCPAHIDIEWGRGPDQDPTSFTLYEGEKGTCTDDLYHQGEISVDTAMSDDLLKIAESVNWGNEPLGCPDSKDIPNGANKSELNYNCPNGGAVVKGVYKKNGKIDTPTIAGSIGEPSTGCGGAGGVFGWIICPLGSLAEGGIKIFDGIMYSILNIPVDQWEKSGLKDVWASMRTIASVLIILVALVGIASQVFNLEVVSAYTIRKLLPKFFIAVILIQLSWFLGTMAINISNTLGYSVQAIITAPFEEAVNQQIGKPAGSRGDGWISFSDVMTVYAKSAENPVAAEGGVVALGIGAAAASGIALALNGPAIALSLVTVLMTAAITMAVGFAVIAIRYILIMAAVVAMPLALVAWILPSTSKWFKRWWEMFFALLAMFPIVIAFLTFGKVAAVIVAMSAIGD